LSDISTLVAGWFYQRKGTMANTHAVTTIVRERRKRLDPFKLHALVWPGSPEYTAR
jgi:hypothetical protein